MARWKKSDAPDLDRAHALTAGLIDALVCPTDKPQAFLRDTKSIGLKVRVTPAGTKSFVYEVRISGKPVRRTIGSVLAWSLEQARESANKLRVLIDKGHDPRELEQMAAEVKALQKRQAEARTLQEAAEAVTVAAAWGRYMEEGKPRGKAAWKPRYRNDLVKMAAPGGEPRKRGGGKMLPGHLHPLMNLRLIDVTPDFVRDWFVIESKRSPVNAVRALAMLAGFLKWCSTRREWRTMVNRDAARAADLADLLPAKVRRTDALELDQLKPWFAGTDKLRSRVARAYLQALVLTGARREEMAALKWSDVDFAWKKITVADKVGDNRTIPLTPYLGSLLASLPREMLDADSPNPYVFASTGKSGHIAEPRAPHADVLADAGVPHVSIHGLRRTFSLVGEAAGAPAGAIAQVMGHRPSAVAEGYRPRSIDALRPYLALVETFFLDRAGIVFDADAVAAGGLRLVSSAA